MPHLGSPSVGHPVVSGEGRWVEAGGVTFPNYGPPGTVTPGGPPGTGVAGPVHPTVSAEGEWVFDPDFATVAPPVDLEAMFPDQPVFDPRGGWGDLVNWWFSHSVADLIPGVSDVEDLPSGGGLMIGPQELVKTADFLKDALMPLLGGDLEVLGLGGVIGPLGPTDPVPIPGGKIVAKGADLAKAGWRAVRGVDEAAEAVSAVVRVGDDLTPGLLRSQGFLGDARLAPTRNIGEGVTVSEIAVTQTDLSRLGGIGGPMVDTRPFVLVRKADGSLQPFYRSTGTWSGMPDRWLPFDGFGGVVNNKFTPGWYRKNRFGQGEFAEGTPLHRFGSEENKALSDLLGAELGDAPATVRFTMEGVDVELVPGMSYDDLNEALGTHSGYGDYLAATVDESPTFTGNPMRVETPAGPTVIDLDAPQPDLPPGTALGPDGEVIRVIGLEDEAAGGVARETGETVARTGVTRPLLETVDELAETAPAFHTSGTYDAVSGRSIFNEPMYHGRATNPTSFDDPALQGTRLGRDVTRQGGGLPGVWTSTELQTARGYSGESGGFVHAVTWEPDRAPRVAHLWEPIPDDLRGVLRTEIEALDEAGDLLAKVDNPQIELGEIITDQRLPVPLIQQALQGRVDVLVDYHGFLWLNPSDLRIAATASNITRPRPGPPLLG